MPNPPSSPPRDRPAPVQEPPTLSARAAAEQLGTTQYMVIKLALRGLIRAVNVPFQSIRYMQEDVEKIVKQRAGG